MPSSVTVQELFSVTCLQTCVDVLEDFHIARQHTKPGQKDLTYIAQTRCKIIIASLQSVITVKGGKKIPVMSNKLCISPNSVPLIRLTKKSCVQETLFTVIDAGG